MEHIENDDELIIDEDLQVVPTTKESKLIDRTKELVESSFDVENSEELKQIVALFNQNIAKKNMLRMLKVGTVLDATTDEMMKRILNDTENIPHKDLVSMYTALQKATIGYQESINGIGNNPVITINNQTINVDTPQFSSESSKKILDTIELLKNMSLDSLQTEEVDDIEVVDEENE